MSGPEPLCSAGPNGEFGPWLPVTVTHQASCCWGTLVLRSVGSLPISSPVLLLPKNKQINSSVMSVRTSLPAHSLSNFLFLRPGGARTGPMESTELLASNRQITHPGSVTCKLRSHVKSLQASVSSFVKGN